MRVAFAGSPEAAATVLRSLVASPHEVALVISQPDRPRGRSGRGIPTAVSEEAARLDIPLVRPRSINDAEVLGALEEAEMGALCVAAFGQIFREPLLSRWTCLNVHFSLLPAYRGASPVERALMDGVDRTGVTVMRMDAGLDTGPVAAEMPVAVSPDDDAGSLTARLASEGAQLLVAALDAAERGELRLRPQPEEGVTLAPKLTEADRRLDFSRPARDLANQVRALSPHVGASCKIDGQPFKVWRARAVEAIVPDGLSVDGERLLARCSHGALEILELQPPGRSRMPGAAFLRGWRGALELTG